MLNLLLVATSTDHVHQVEAGAELVDSKDDDGKDDYKDGDHKETSSVCEEPWA